MFPGPPSLLEYDVVGPPPDSSVHLADVGGAGQRHFRGFRHHGAGHPHQRFGGRHHQEAPDHSDEKQGRQGEADERAPRGNESAQAIRMGAILLRSGTVESTTVPPNLPFLSFKLPMEKHLKVKSN